MARDRPGSLLARCRVRDGRALVGDHPHRGPSEVLAVDPAKGFLAAANALIGGTHFAASVGDAAELPFPDDHFDVVVSGLVLNFVPDLGRALAEAGRVTRPGGTVGANVWDYVGRMQMIRLFWDAAVGSDPAAQGTR